MVTAQDLMRRDYVSVDIRDSVSQLLGKLNKAKQHSAVVFDGKKYLGIVSPRFLLTSRINPKQMKVGNIVKHRSKSKAAFFVPKLEPNTDLRRMCKLLATADTHILPVLQKGRLLGIVNSHDVVKEVANAYRAINCDELATMQPITATENAPLGKVLQLFNRQKIDHIPIVDEKGKLSGIVTISDLMSNPQFWGPTYGQKISRAASHQKGSRSGYDSGEKTQMIGLPVRNCMSRRTTCCTPPSTSISEAVKIMGRNKVSNIVLVRFEKPVGILTIKDILQDYAK